MLKKYIVRLTDQERSTLQKVVEKFKGSSQKVRRAQVLLKADADGPAWTDAKIAEAYGCRTKTVENIRQRLVTEGFETTLHGQSRLKPPCPKLLDGAQEAKVIALTSLKNHGYILALDDYVGQGGYEEVIRLADIVKVDLLGMAPDRLREVSQGLKSYGCRLLAEKVVELEIVESISYETVRRTLKKTG